MPEEEHCIFTINSFNPAAVSIESETGLVVVDNENVVTKLLPHDIVCGQFFWYKPSSGCVLELLNMESSHDVVRRAVERDSILCKGARYLAREDQRNQCLDLLLTEYGGSLLGNEYTHKLLMTRVKHQLLVDAEQVMTT